MPGAITNAQLNPEQSWMDFHPNQDVSIYRDAINKGYVYGGGDNWTGGGTPQNAFEQKAANGGVPGGTFHGGAAVTGGAGMGGSTQGYGGGMSFGSSYGGKNPFATDAAAAKMRDEFARLRKSGKGAMDEGLAARGIFSSGVGARLQSEQDTQYGLAEGAALEDLYNRSSQQEMAFQLEMERMKQQALYGGGGGSQRFSGANTGGNENQQLMNYYSSKGSGNTSAPGYQTGPMGHASGPLGNYVEGGGGMMGGDLAALMGGMDYPGMQQFF